MTAGSGGGEFPEDRREEDAARAEVAALERSEPRYQWPLTIVLLGLLVSLAIVAGDHFRRGSVLFALFVSLAFGLRLMLSDEECGWLVVRSRRFDQVFLGALALALSVASLIVPSPS
jgi:Protein of unknown function (DUF3017)